MKHPSFGFALLLGTAFPGTAALYQSEIRTWGALGSVRSNEAEAELLSGSLSDTETEQWLRHGRFTSGRGILGETVPQGNLRHPFWHFEGQQLARFQAYICCVVLFMASVLCAAGGIGGGGIYVTVLMVAGKMGLTDAVPLSKAIVFFGSMSSWVLNSRKLVSWETKRETAIDYNICRLVVPGSLSGTLIGVILNRSLPNWVILAVLCFILVFITLSVGWTTVKLYLQEKAQDIEDEREEAVVAAEVARSRAAKPTAPLAVPPTALPAVKETEPEARPVPEADTLSNLVQKQTSLGGGKSLRRLSRRPSMNAPDITRMRNKLLWTDILTALGVLFTVITAGVLRFHSGECFHADPAVQRHVCRHPVVFWLGSGTLQAWMEHGHADTVIKICTIVIPFCLCILAEVYYARLLIRHERWRLKEVCTYCIVATITGCLSGLVGIGGGLIFSPFFLISGVHPSVAVATSSTCVIFTSASTSLQYLLTDRIIVSLTVVYGSISLIASYLGTSFVNFLEVRFWGRKSYVSGIVFMGVLVSTALSIFKFFCTR